MRLQKPPFGAGIKITFRGFLILNSLTFFERHVPKKVVLKSARGRNSAYKKYSFRVGIFSWTIFGMKIFRKNLWMGREYNAAPFDQFCKRLKKCCIPHSLLTNVQNRQFVYTQFVYTLCTWLHRQNCTLLIYKKVRKFGNRKASSVFCTFPGFPGKGGMQPL